MTAKSELNLNLCTDLEMLRSIQLLFAFFATQNFILTTKSPYVGEVVWLAGALTHPKTGTSTQSLTSVCFTPRALLLPANALAIPSSTHYMAGDMLGVRMINAFSLAILGYRESELEMRAVYSKLYSPDNNKKTSL